MIRLPRLLLLPNKFLRRRARRRRMATLLALVILLLLLILPLGIAYRPPNLLIRYFAWRWPDVLWHVPLPRGAPKLVALTIDDAPSDHTPEILAALREHEAHATFFVIGGQVSGREDVLRAVVRGGHELANHAMHDEPARALSDDELAAQLRTVDGMINATYAAEWKPPPPYGVDGAPRFFRPGSGFFSSRIRALAARLGYRVVLGSVYPHDAQIGYSWLNARHVLSLVRPGAIIINHDRRSWTAPMLKVVLPELKRRGYTVVTLTELLTAGKGESR